MSRLEVQFTDTENDAKHDFQSLKEDIRNKNLEEKHALRIQLEGTIEELWRQFQTAWTNYNNATEERKQQFESLKNKDFQSARTIEQQMKKLQKLQDTITFLKSKMTNTSKEFEEKTRTLKEEKETIQKQFQFLKKRMNQYRDVERKKLVELAKLSGKVYTDLEKKVDQVRSQCQSDVGKEDYPIRRNE
jgi:chromosome segregation ATPase